MALFLSRYVLTYLNKTTKQLSVSIDKNCPLTSHLCASVVQQITRNKSRKTGGLDAYGNKELGKYADDLLLLLEKRRNPPEKEIKKWKNDLSGILFQYSQRGHEPMLLTLFQRMIDRLQANEASYTIVMRYYAHRGDYDKVKYYFDHMKDSGILYHGRSFVPLIVLSLRMNKLDQVELYFNQLLQDSRKKFVHNAFIDIIDACADLKEETGTELDLANHLVDQALKIMERFGSEPLDSDATQTLLKWFNRFLTCFF